MKKGMNKDYIFECLELHKEISANFEFLGVVSMKGVKVKHIIFEDCVFNDKFLLTEISNVINIEFTNCTFEKYFSLENIEKTHTILFSSCIFNQWIDLENVKCSMLRVENCKLFSSFTLENVVIDDAIFAAEEVSCEGTIIIDSPQQKNVTFTSLSKSYFKSISLENFIKIEIDANVQQLELVASFFKSLEVVSTKETNTINEISICDIHFEGNVLFEDIDIHKLIIVNASCNKGMLTIAHTNIRDINVQNCQIDNLFLNQVAMENPPELLGSNLKAWRLSGVVWADNNRSLKDSYLSKKIFWFYWLLKTIIGKKYLYDKDDVSLIKDHIETYRQLKAASISNHNEIEALAFYRNEMKLYWKLVRIEGGIAWYNRILIFTNRFVSDFGQNWFSPLVFLLLFHWFFVSCVLEFSYFSNNLTGSEELGRYFYLLNPVHSSPDYIKEGWGNVTEFFMRVFGGYFIYHFIKATRKFGKV